MSTELDPVTLALVQNRLDHISHQMGWVMTRTARSLRRTLESMATPCSVKA